LTFFSLLMAELQSYLIPPAGILLSRNQACLQGWQK
jgi:hypothetical protein